MRFTQHYFNLGYNLQKQAGRTEAAIGGLLPYPLGDKSAYLFSEKDKAWKSYLGQSAGMLSGYGLGVPLHYIAGFEHNPIFTALPLGMLGGSLGAYLSHGKDSKDPKKQEMQVKGMYRELKKDFKKFTKKHLG